MNVLRRLCLGILFVFAQGSLAAQDDEAGTEPAPAQRVLTWNVEGSRQRLTVTTNDARLSVGEDHSVSLESVVGPMVSTRFSQTWEGGSGWYLTEYLQVEYRGAYRFSLASYLEKSGQGGRVLAALLKGQANRPPKCPPLEEVRKGPSFTKGREQLLEAGCGEPRWFTLEPDAFSVLDWDGRDEVQLAIQHFHPEAVRTVLTLERVSVWLKAPSEWRPWLKAAQRGQGLFEARKFEWLNRLPTDELADLRKRAAKLRPTARRELIADSVYRARQAPLSAAELVGELFPVTEGAAPDLASQWAWSDRLLYLRSFPEQCLKAAGVLFQPGWSAEPARAAAFNFTRCTGWQGEDTWRMCQLTDDPVACIKPGYELRQEEARRSAKTSPAQEKLDGMIQ
ncbi:hypothetical protein [Myxococcus qinghaiensis]|uniref:hypothetical protein n=1 Tax=Myxococcus qinghaiensis TaxID=2906758 RepID=UPI0020A80233|nr:hypothetical protein [Myxococcus qinghaiensis]MCP3166037.1 hypothetical protein [Myxococcus qinghaiensis]